ncbi:MAG TPA: hypothetical protein VJZ17_03575 [Nitrosopumilaceae archaeon]|nr:hypothetical protein [Nitrosopumilaceae archaeon]
MNKIALVFIVGLIVIAISAFLTVLYYIGDPKTFPIPYSPDALSPVGFLAIVGFFIAVFSSIFLLEEKNRKQK